MNLKKILKWLDNIGYHYKFHIIAVIFFVIFIVIVTLQMTNREKIDINILYTGPEYIGSELKSMKTAFVQTMTYDYNGDGEKGVQITDITLLSDEQLSERTKAANAAGERFLYNPKEIQDSKKKFDLEIFSGEALICLLDPYWFNYIVEASGLLPLKDALGYTPDNFINEYGVYLKDTKFGQFFTVFETLPDDTILCFRRMTTTSIFKGAKKEEARYNNHKQMLKDIFEFTLKEDTPS